MHPNRRPMTTIERRGVLPVDKPAGPSSHDIVARARRALGERRIGHTGTLDPFASGLLLLCVGAATRIAEYLTDLPKRYRAVMTLGAGTDTDDVTGTVIATSDSWRDLTAAAVEDVLRRQIGVVLQRPPAYSAKKVGGERMYKLAREGRAPVLEPVAVEIGALDIIAWAPPDVTFDVACSAGTYIRAIARDAGDGLGVPAHLSALRRTAIGTFLVDDAVSADALDDEAVVREAWITPLAAVAHLPLASLDDEAAEALTHGRAIAAPGIPAGLAAAGVGDRLIAIVESDGRSLRPRKVFA
jgi:tRNA pseudouridine55 synthase